MSESIRGVELGEYVLESVSINTADIQNEFSRYSGDLAYWGEVYATAYGAYQRAKTKLSRTRAILELQARDRLFREGHRGIEAQVDALVETNQTYQVAQDELVSLDIERVRVHGRLEAVRAKRDMLVSLGAQVRAELQGDPSVREGSQERPRRFGTGR